MIHCKLYTEGIQRFPSGAMTKNDPSKVLLPRMKENGEDSSPVGSWPTNSQWPRTMNDTECYGSKLQLFAHDIPETWLEGTGRDLVVV